MTAGPTRRHAARAAGRSRRRRAPLPRLHGGRVRPIPDAEVLELVAAAIDVELTATIDGRRLRRLNSAVNRYRLERRAAQQAGASERYTSRVQLARSLYGADVELNDVKRQMRRVEADLAAAGLLEVEVARGAGGEDRALKVRLLEPAGRAGARARRHLARRPETRAEALERRVAPWRRQQSDRRNRGGVPGLYVRRSSLCIATPGPSALFGTTSLESGRAEDQRRERRALAAAAPGPRRRASSPSLDPIERRAWKAPPGPHRWAALDRLRQAAREGGLESLRVAAESGAPPAPIAVVAFEVAFVLDLPGSWAGAGDPWAELRARLPELHAAGHTAADAPHLPPIGYVPLSDRWARRLEAACRIIDREVGVPGAGALDLLRDVERWRPSNADALDAGALGWPVSPAYFVARLRDRARTIRRLRDPARRSRSLWHEDERPHWKRNRR